MDNVMGFPIHPVRVDVEWHRMAYDGVIPTETEEFGLGLIGTNVTAFPPRSHRQPSAPPNANTESD